MDKKIVIIGTGPCGLGAAWRLQQLGYKDWQIYERNNYVGGLSASFKDDKGFTWDIGGHVIFSHYEYFDSLLEQILQKDYLAHRRRAYIRILKRWVPYPFQNNIRFLPPRAGWECLSGLLSSRKKQQGNCRNFRDWILLRFGPGIAKYFMFPYNSKVWCYPLEEMSYDWIGERVSVVDYRKVLGNFIFGRKDISWGKNRAFKFPLFGGTGEIFRRFIPYIKEHLFVNKEMTKIDLKTREIFFNDGSRTDYDILISTIPLDKFIEVAGLTQFSGLKNNLRHNGILSVGLGLKKSAFSDKCWVYFPESNCPFYRITYFSNYSPNNTSSGEYSSLICETAYSEFKPYPKDKVIEDTIQGLINAGVLSAEDKKRIVSTYLIDVEYAYPIPNLGRDEALNTVQPYLLQNNIYSRGRFGAWRYERGNTDYSLMQGVEAVDEILGINRD